MNKLTLYLSFVMALFMFSACASQPKSTVKADSAVIYADEASGYNATAVMEYFKKTNEEQWLINNNKMVFVLHMMIWKKKIDIHS